MPSKKKQIIFLFVSLGIYYLWINHDDTQNHPDDENKTYTESYEDDSSQVEEKSNSLQTIPYPEYWSLTPLEEWRFTPVIIKVNNTETKEEFIFHISKKGTLELKKRDDNLNINSAFILTENLSFPERKPSNFSISSLRKPGQFLVNKGKELTLEPYKNSDHFKVASSYNAWRPYPKQPQKLVITHMNNKSLGLNHLLTAKIFSNIRPQLDLIENSQDQRTFILELEKYRGKKPLSHFVYLDTKFQYQTYVYNKELDQFQTINEKLPDNTYYQPINIKAIKTHLDGTPIFKKESTNLLLMHRTKKYASKNMRNSLNPNLMIVPSPLSLDDDPSPCIMIYGSSISKPDIDNNQYLVHENYRLIFKPYDGSQEFIENATFCTKKIGQKFLRLESYRHRGYYIDHHNLRDVFFYLVPHDSTYTTTSLIEIVPRKTLNKSFVYKDLVDNKLISFKYTKEISAFTYMPSIDGQETLEKTININTNIKIDSLNSLNCHLYNRKKQIYYPQKERSSEKITFHINRQDNNKLKSLICQAQSNTNETLQIICPEIHEYLEWESNCHLSLNINNSTKKFPVNHWDLNELENFYQD